MAVVSLSGLAAIEDQDQSRRISGAVDAFASAIKDVNINRSGAYVYHRSLLWQDFSGWLDLSDFWCYRLDIILSKSLRDLKHELAGQLFVAHADRYRV